MRPAICGRSPTASRPGTSARAERPPASNWARSVGGRLASRAAIAEDGAEAICLGCAGMGPLDKSVQAELGVPVLDGTACAVKLVEGIVDYGLFTSRVAAYKEPEPKEFVGLPPRAVSA